MSPPGADDAAAILAERVYAGGRSKAFAELTRGEVEERAESCAARQPEELVARAQKLWVVPPGGSLLR
jgi:hypothetical protein